MSTSHDEGRPLELALAGLSRGITDPEGHTGAIVRAAVAAGARWAAILVRDTAADVWRVRRVAPAQQEDVRLPLRPLLRSVERASLMRGAPRVRSRMTLARLHQRHTGEAVLAVNWPAGAAEALAPSEIEVLTAASFGWAADEAADEIRALRCALEDAAHNELALGSVARQAAGLAHDFNNALTSILGFSEWLLSDEETARRVHAELSHIHEAALAASEVVRRLRRLVHPYRLLGDVPAATPSISARPALEPGLSVTVPAPAGYDCLSILVVDDQPDVCDSLGTMLEALGHAPVLATSGESAVQALSDRRFDVLITDLSMPGMGGLELVRHAIALRPGTCIVVMTGWGAAEEAEAEAGVSLVLGKPVTLGALRDALTKVFGRAA